MCRTMSCQVILTLLMLGSCALLSAQNLVPNYSFETITSCPTGFGGAGPTLAPPWTAPTMGSPDLFNACSTNAITDVPTNFFGTQDPVTGDGYAGIYCKLVSYEYREYIQAPLTSPLVAGTWYNVSFYTAPAEYGCPMEHMGAALTTTAPSSNSVTHLNLTAQVENMNGFISDYENWTLISGCFQAEGGEQYITIGNFYGDADTPLDPDCQSTGNAYYYIEDVVVQEGTDPAEMGELPLELGDPVFACFSHEIDPDAGDYNYIWSTGSHDPSITVTETGVYVLTLTDGCNYAIDSVEVTIGGNFDAPDIGPNQLELCEGEVYSISLDPDLFEYTWNDGSHDSDYSISQSGTYSVTLDDGCAVLSDEIEVTLIYPPIPVDLGDDRVLCFGDEFDIWLDPSLGEFLWQDGSTTSSFLVSEGGTYAVTISNMCGEESDEVVFTDLEVPDVQIGPDDQTICNGDIIEIEVDPDLGEINWQDGSSQPNYEIYLPGTYTCFVTNECGTGSDQIEVTVIEPPSVYLGPDTTLCPGETLALTTLPTEGTYTWQDGSDTDSLVVTNPGTYSLSVSNFCGIASDVVQVDFGVAITPIDFGPDVSLCPGEQIVLHALNPGADHLWQDGTTADSLIVNSSGTYSVLVSDYCGQTTDTIAVIVNDDPPAVDLPDALTLCQGQSLVLDAVVTGVSYMWSDASTNQQLTVIAPGAYSVTVSNTCGTDRDTVVIADGGPAPLVALGQDTSICAGQSFTLSPVFSNVSAWLWGDGSTQPSFPVTGSGVVTVQVNNSCGVSFDTLAVGLLPALPPLDLGSDSSLCSGQSFTLTISIPAVNITWLDGSTNPNYTVAGPGAVYASISNSCGMSTDTIDVVALPDIPNLNLGNDQSLCPGELITLSPGISNVTYLWQDGSTANTYASTQEETVILTITNACGASTDTLEIFESTQGPFVNLGSDIQVCAGMTVTIPSGISGVTYLWQDGSTNPDFTTTQSGVFILEVSNLCGTDSDTIAVDISGVAPSVDLGPDTVLCEGVMLQLTSSADDITSITWQDGSSLPTFLVSVAGTYVLAETNRCGDATDTVVVGYLAAPVPFTLGSDTTLCPGQSILLVSPSTAFDQQWQDGSTQSSLIADAAGIYSLELSNDCGTVSDELVVDVDNRIPVVDFDPTIFWCPGDVISLDASQPFSAQYLWSTGDASPAIDVNMPGTYTIDVLTPCSAISESVDIVLDDDCIAPDVHNDIFIPNVFSPNGDQINDFFSPSFGSDIAVISLTGAIYDRWGNVVFQSTGPSFTWDGLYAGEQLLPGAYVYAIHIVYFDGTREREKQFAGDITLVR